MKNVDLDLEEYELEQDMTLKPVVKAVYRGEINGEKVEMVDYIPIPTFHEITFAEPPRRKKRSTQPRN